VAIEPIQFDIKAILGEISQDMKTMSRDMADIRERVATVEVRMDNMATKEDIARLDADITVVKATMATKEDIARLDANMQGLDKRLGNQEFTNRGILVSLVVGLVSAIAAAAAKLLNLI